MFYWNPLRPETQFFFNDRDVKTGKVLTVIYDIDEKKRVRQYRYDDTPVGNGGVAYDGSAWLGLNYGRLARLRLVTGYPEALDWSRDEIAPNSDGIFIVDIKTGKKWLLVSYRQLDEKLKELKPDFGKIPALMEGLFAVTIVATCVWATNARKTSRQQSKPFWDGGGGEVRSPVGGPA
jgi:hypothetical protein